MADADEKRTPRVAVIDDETIVCREVKRGLAKDHYPVETLT